MGQTNTVTPCHNKRHGRKHSLAIGSMGKDDHDDDSVNVAKKLSCVLSKFIASIWTPLVYLSTVGHFSWSGILKDFIYVQKEKGRFFVVCSRPP